MKKLKLRREVKFILSIIIMLVVLHWSGAFYYLTNKDIGVDNIKVVQFIIFSIASGTFFNIGRELANEKEED